MLAVEKLSAGKLIVEGLCVPFLPGTPFDATTGSGRRIFAIGSQHGISVAGLMADCRQLVLRARAEASNWKST